MRTNYLVFPARVETKRTVVVTGVGNVSEGVIVILGHHPALPLVVVIHGVVEVHGGQDGLALECWSPILIIIHHCVVSQQLRVVLSQSSTAGYCDGVTAEASLSGPGCC